MRFRHLIITCGLLLLGAFPVQAVISTENRLIKGSHDAVFYLADDGKRYLFPNRQTFDTWYADFSGIREISDEELSEIPLGGNVTYRPGVRMVKVTSAPHVYAVAAGGVLRWVKSETVAAQMYGADWRTKVDDLPITLFTNYTMGQPIDTVTDFQPIIVTAGSQVIEEEKASIKKEKTEAVASAEGTEQAPATTSETEQARPKGTAPRTTAPKTEGETTGEAAAPTGETTTGEAAAPTGETTTGETTGSGTEEPSSAAEGGTTEPSAPTTTETTTPPTETTGTTTTAESGTTSPPTETTGGTTEPPTTTTEKSGSHVQSIGGVAATNVTASSATIVWQTNTTATSFVDYGAAPGTYGQTAGAEKPPVKDHSVTISGLSPATTYYYRVRSTHGSGDEMTSSDYIFTTLAP